MKNKNGKKEAENKNDGKTGLKEIGNPLARVFHEAHAHKRVVVTPRLPRKLERLRALPRKHFHPLQHDLHAKHKLSRKTLFYVKEYGAHSNVAGTIIKESIKILLLASIVSSLGGFALENIKAAFVAIVPLVVLLPALNDMIGDYASIISSRFSTMLHEGKVRGCERGWWKNAELHKLFMQVLFLAVFTATLGAAAALVISSASFAVSALVAFKVFAIALIDAVLLVTVLFFVAIAAGFYFFGKGEDPSNFLIPITTSIADFGNMLLLALLVTVFF